MNSNYIENVKAAASSKTYRNATKRLAKSVRVPVKHSSSPREDFETMIDVVGEQSKKRALSYYERGLRIGLIKALDAVRGGRVKLRNGVFSCRSNKVVISRKFRFRDQPSETRRFKFRLEDLQD